jgi:hypothetical protein
MKKHLPVLLFLCFTVLYSGIDVLTQKSSFSGSIMTTVASTASAMQFNSRVPFTGEDITAFSFSKLMILKNKSSDLFS